MNYHNTYSANMDYVRAKFNLPETTSLYECVGRLVEAYKDLVEVKQETKEQEQQQSLKEKKDDRGNDTGVARRKRGRPAKRK